ncbi:MAG: cadmium-translocating P-type ATPase [Oscillospiraceae bacterium]|nr:cadmium-translocating P-type ATPase [Oscillospiraceae bacterium]
MKKQLMEIIVSAVIFIIALLVKTDIWFIKLALFLAAWLVVGWKVLWKAIRNIARGQVFDEDFLMTIASVGAFIIGEYPEAVAVMLFFAVGEMLEKAAVRKSRESIAELMDIRPDYANLKTEDGLIKVDPDEVNVGDIIVIKPGERVPLDGVVIEGISSLDTSSITGESMPRDVRENDEIISGCVNGSGVLAVRVTREFDESTVSRILELVEDAAAKKARTESFITRFAAVYTPAVCIAAVLVAVIPPLFVGNWATWIYRALSFLVVSCPCALVISVPLSFFGGIGGASRLGILVKGSSAIEQLSKAEVAVFDKTGTLTKGVFAVTSIVPAGVDEDELIKLAAHVESFSSHPVARCIREKYGKTPDESIISNVQEIAGQGVTAEVSGEAVAVGNARLMESVGAQFTPYDGAGTVVYVAVDGAYAGCIAVEDVLRDDAKETMAELKAVGVKRTVMLTGDNRKSAEKTAEKVGIDTVYSELLPQDKVELAEKLISEKSEKGVMLYAGDGINDAPVLARADVGIAMGGLGSDAAVEAADVVIMTDEPSKIARAIKISKKTMDIVRQNIIFSIGVKLLVLVLTAFGVVGMWAAVFADVGVSMIAVLNALRAMKTE